MKDLAFLAYLCHRCISPKVFGLELPDRHGLQESVEVELRLDWTETMN